MDFSIKNKKLLFWRLGNINSNKQKHFGEKGSHQPPVSRGIWCFPYPFHDYFFVYHQWESKLPKKYRKTWNDEGYADRFEKMTIEEVAQYHAEREKALKKVQNLYRPKQFWYGGKFYSHIGIHGQSDYGKWFLWESVSDWAKEARKHLYHFERLNGSVHRFKYSADHLEIFIPNYK